jgi:hypothetical protein
MAQEDVDLEIKQDLNTISVTTTDEQLVKIAAVRVANMMPGVPGLDLTVDGRLSIRDIVYGGVSGYILVPIDQVKLALMPHIPIDQEGKIIEGNQPPELIPFAATLEADRYYTVVFSHAETSETGQEVFHSSLINIFENTFETPLPGQARIRLNNTSASPIRVDVKQTEEGQEVGSALATVVEIFQRSTEVLNIPFGSYVFSFGDSEAELEVVVQAGTFYTFYIFRDGEALVINPDVDGILGTLIESESP